MTHSKYRPVAAIELLDYVHDLTSALGFEIPAAAARFANHFAVQLVAAHRDGVAVADAAASLRPEADSWLASGACLTESDTDSEDALAQVKDHVVLSLSVSKESAAGDTRLFAALEVRPGDEVLHGPTCAMRPAIRQLGFELGAALGLDYDHHDQFFELADQVEIGIRKRKVKRISDFPSIMREQGWTVDAGGYKIDEEAEAALVTLIPGALPWHLDTYENRMAQSAAEEMLGAVRGVLGVLVPDRDSNVKSGSDRAMDVARVALVVEAEGLSLFAAAAEYKFIEANVDGGVKHGTIGLAIGNGLEEQGQRQSA